MEQLFGAGVALQVFHDGLAFFGGQRGHAGCLNFGFHHRDLRVPHRGGHFVWIVRRVAVAASTYVELRAGTGCVGERRGLASCDED